MMQNPLIPRTLSALTTAAFHPEIRLYAFFPAADFLTDTIFPDLLFLRSLFFNPLAVLALVPLNTETFPRFPLAMTDFFMAIFFMPIFLAMAIFFMPIFLAMAAIFIFIAILSE